MTAFPIASRFNAVRDVVRRLADVEPGPYRVVSCYLKLEPRDKTRAKYLIKMKNRVREALARLERQELDRAVRDGVAADLERVRRYFEEPGRLPSSRGIALFACRTLGLFEVVPLPHVHRSRLRVEATPLVRELVSRVDRDKARVDFVKRYSDLYGAYTEAEVIYTDDRMLALFESLGADDRARFPFDSASIDWRYYLQDVHSPAVTQSLRELSRRARDKPMVKIVERDRPVVALFDMEGTIITSNVVESYVWTKMADLPPEEWPKELGSVFGRIPSYLQIDRRDRGDFLRTFFRRYEGASVAGVERLIDRHVGEFMLQKASPEAIRRIRAHRAAGHRTILITAAAEIFVRPLTPLFDIVIGCELEVRDGRYTGFMSSPPLVGEARAAWLRRYALQEGVDLKHSYAYADSYSDLPLLRAVGNPVAVSPDSALYRYARRRRWPIEGWAMSNGMPRVRFPKPAMR